MQGFLPILVFWLIFAFIGSLSKNAKKRTQQQAQQAKAAQQRMAAAPQAAPQPKAPAPAAVQKTHLETDAKPFEAHMHEPVMDQEGVGTEGIDCCHEFMLESPQNEPQADFLPLTDHEEEERAKMLLQGVIFSEVLGRRPIRRYGGKHA